MNKDHLNVVFVCGRCRIKENLVSNTSLVRPCIDLVCIDLVCVYVYVYVYVYVCVYVCVLFLL